MGHVNPLKEDALTADDVRAGDRLICWVPGKPGTRKKWTALSSVYFDEGGDDDGTMVIDVEDQNGQMATLNTDAVGLTGNRFTGEWSVIAIIDEEID